MDFLGRGGIISLDQARILHGRCWQTWRFSCLNISSRNPLHSLALLDVTSCSRLSMAIILGLVLLTISHHHIWPGSGPQTAHKDPPLQPCYPDFQLQPMQPGSGFQLALCSPLTQLGPQCASHLLTQLSLSGLLLIRGPRQPACSSKLYSTPACLPWFKTPASLVWPTTLPVLLGVILWIVWFSHLGRFQNLSVSLDISQCDQLPEDCSD